MQTEDARVDPMGSSTDNPTAASNQTTPATVPLTSERLLLLADRVQRAHGWLWDGGTVLHLDSHDMAQCVEDHAGCAHVSLVEAVKRIVPMVNSHEALVSALRAVDRVLAWDGALPRPADVPPADELPQLVSAA